MGHGRAPFKGILQRFCQGAQRNPDELTLRLEQRPRIAARRRRHHLLRIRLRDATPKPFSGPVLIPPRLKPIAKPSARQKDNPDYAAWFYKQYYSAYGLPRPNLYPWTALGYTFDWAQGNNGEFARYGESEFVISRRILRLKCWAR